jgi:hypothetical protein
MLRQRIVAIVDPCSNLGIFGSTVGSSVRGTFLNIHARSLSAMVGKRISHLESKLRDCDKLRIQLRKRLLVY